MFQPSFGQNVIAILGIPAVLWITALGTGLAIERVARAELSNALVLPLGLAGSIVLVSPLYALGWSDVPAVLLLALVTAGGLIWARGGIRSRLNPGLPGLAGLGVYVLFMLPVIGAGHWLWLGYNLDNDTSIQFMLTASMKVRGTQMLAPTGSFGYAVDSYLRTGYPLGSHDLLATLSGVLRSDPAVVYQGFLSSLAAIIGVTVAGASERVIGARRAVVLGFAAASANLFLQYAFQGTIKEVATAATTIAAVAIAAEALRLRRPYSGVAIAAIPLAATLCTYGAGGAPYLLALVGGVVLQLVGVERRVPRVSWIAPALFGAALVAALSVPALVDFSTFFGAAKGAVGNTSPVGSLVGNLARPLPLSQISGVWLDGDFRLPVVPQPAAALTNLATAAILLLLVPGIVSSLWRREAAPVLAAVTTGLVLLIVVPRVTPYAAAKVFAMGSPIVVWVAGIGLCALAWKALKPLTIVLGAALTLAIVISDVLAYHDAQISSTSRMLAMEAVADHLAGRGQVLFNEADEFVKYFARAAESNAAFDSISPRQALLIDPQDTFDQYFDLDQETLAYIESFPAIVTRRSPIASRPPSNYKLVYSNAYYEGWERENRPAALAHLGLQSTYSGTAVPACSSVASLVQGAPRDDELVQAVVPASTGFDILGAPSRPGGWGPNPNPPYGSVVTNGPGFVHENVSVPVSGLYQAWVQGSFPRPIQVLVNGRVIGSVFGADSVSQWAPAGEVRLAAGVHELTVHRAGGRIYPGDGAFGWIGFVTLRKVGPEVLRTVPLREWRSLCSAPADWIELVKP